MSFFFARKRLQKPVQRVSGRGAIVPAQSKELLWRLGCKACPLDKADCHTPKMSPVIVKGASVYIMAEAPGKDEDERSGRPLTGPSGLVLRACLSSAQVSGSSFDNVANCRPPGNRTPTQQEIECCRPRKVKHIEEAKPKLILGLGAVPLQAIMGTGDLAGMRGRVFAVKIGEHACWFMPTYHPAFLIYRAQNKAKPLQSMLGHCFRMDIEKAFEAAERLPPPIIDSEEDIRKDIYTDATFMRLEKARLAPIKAIDIETKGLSPHAADAAIMTVAISTEYDNFSFPLDHPKAGWSKDRREVLRKALRDIISDATIKVAHNAPFEIEWLAKECGVEAINHEAWHCTQMQAHFLDERKGARRDDDNKASKYQSLDFLVKQYFGISYKSTFKLNKKDMSQSDLGETLIYNAVDTKYTLRLFNLQLKLLEERGLLGAYLDSAQRQPTVALMQYLGVPVDQEAVFAAQQKLNAEVLVLENSIYDEKVVKTFIADRKEFNWASQPNVLSLFKDYLKRPEVVVVDKSGKERLSVDKNILDQIDHPLANLIVKIRNRSKMKSTYVDGLEAGKGALIYPDGKLHANFNTTFTETGRTSSDQPNMQNFPKRQDAWVRGQIAAPKGYVMVAVDYKQLEASTGAICSKDKYLTKALWEDYDTHAEWAKKTAMACPEFIGGKKNFTDVKVMKDFRSLIKNKLVFPAFFGASNQSVHDYLWAATGHDADQSIIDKLMTEFWHTFSGMLDWQQKTMKRYYEVGYVETMCGRRHHYPLTKNQAVNMPIQGTAMELVGDAMNRLSRMAVETEKWHLHPLMIIHDDLTFIIPDNDEILEESLRIISREMLTFDYDWINVPLAIEISIGKNWADMVRVEDVWSHKEFGFPHK